MNTQKQNFVYIFFLFAILTQGYLYSQEKLYFTVPNSATYAYTITSSDIDGTNILTVLPDDNTHQPSGIALDLTNNKIYFTDIANDKIRRCNLDGSNSEDLVSNINAIDITLDVSGGKMYYTISDQPRLIYTVNRADLDGSNPEVLVPDEGSQSPSGISLDLTNNKVYFTDTANKKIRKCNLDGSNLEDILTNVRAVDIALDVDGGKLYYTVVDAPNVIYTLNRANLNGSIPEIIIPDTDGTQAPSGLALDLINDKIYFTDPGNNLIRRCNLDGSGITTLISNIDATSIVGTNTNPPLPVELTYFSGQLEESQVKLTWQTATEINNYGFDVERKAETDSVWVKIGFVEGHGTSNSPKDYSFVDIELPNGNEVSYRLKQIDIDGSHEFSKVVTIDLSTLTAVKEDNLSYEFALEQNYPNPFNPSTTIKFSIPNSGFVTLKIYDLVGREVSTIVSETRTAGMYEVQFNSYNLSSGSYFYTLESGNFRITKQMMLIK